MPYLNLCSYFFVHSPIIFYSFNLYFQLFSYLNEAICRNSRPYLNLCLYFHQYSYQCQYPFVFWFFPLPRTTLNLFFSSSLFSPVSTPLLCHMGIGICILDFYPPRVSKSLLPHIHNISSTLFLEMFFFCATWFSYFQNVTHDNHSNANCAFTINCDKTIASLQLTILLRNQKVEKL